MNSISFPSRRLLPALLALACAVSAHAASKTYLIDFGAPNHTPYVFKAGDFGLATAPVVIADPDTGDHAGFGYKNVTFKLGSAVLSFPTVGCYNLNEDDTPLAALTGSFFFSNPNREDAGSPVTFTLTTAAKTDKITIAAISSVQGGHKALLTVETTKILVDSNETFVPVIVKLTGKTSYAGNFATESGSGEANLGGLLITIESN
jgi:hypothetical protein